MISQDKLSEVFEKLPPSEQFSYLLKAQKKLVIAKKTKAIADNLIPIIFNLTRLGLTVGMVTVMINHSLSNKADEIVANIRLVINLNFNHAKSSDVQSFLSAKSIIDVMQQKEYKIRKGKGRYNIVYIRGVNLTGSFNKEVPNLFNDVGLLIEIDDAPKIIGKWQLRYPRKLLD